MYYSVDTQIETRVPILVIMQILGPFYSLLHLRFFFSFSFELNDRATTKYSSPTIRDSVIEHE